MARNREPIVKRCRALGISPSYLGYNKSSKRVPNKGRKKLSEYGMQLQEKQKAKFIYGVMEKPFRNYYHKANRMSGQTGENLIILLEKRFDNIVFRAGFAKTRREARQMVVHNHFTVNGKKANIPSMEISEGDVIQMKEKSAQSPHFKAHLENLGVMAPPSWMELDVAGRSVKMVGEPNREELDIPINEQMIVELYSK